MALAPYKADSVRPAVGNVLVMFIRPHAYFGKAIGSSLYDGDKFLGLLTDNTVIAHQTTPGRHVFMLLSGQPAAPSFLEGELTTDLTYFVQIAPRSAWTRPPFHLVPLDPKEQGRRIEMVLGKAPLLTMDEQAQRWDRENRPSVKRKKALRLNKWQADPHRMIIPSHYGVALGAKPGTIVFSSDNSGESRAGPEATTPSEPEPSTRLQQLERLREQGLVTEEEYREKRQHIIDDF